MLKQMILSSAALLIAGSAWAEEKPMFHCTSAVAGFTSFTIFQNSEVTDVATTSQLNLKIDMVEGEAWSQYGEARVWAGTPILECQFQKPSSIPGQPPERIYVSINPSGRGAISVASGLDPIQCEKLY